jgi:CBS-domain-containing membrane protein
MLNTRKDKPSLQHDLAMALLPTLTVLLVLAVLEAFSRQRLLFASLASSAFLIYLAPQHKANEMRTLVGSQMGAVLVGVAARELLGAGYWAAAGSMIVVIAAMIALDAVHPPAVSTALSFAFVDPPGPPSNAWMFAGAVLVLALLAQAQRMIAARLERRREPHREPHDPPDNERL